MSTLWASGCLGSAQDSTSCSAGEERCECYANGTCNEGLECLSNHCVDTGQSVDMDRDAASGSADDSDASQSGQDELGDEMTDDGSDATQNPKPKPAGDDTTPSADGTDSSDPTSDAPDGGASQPAEPSEEPVSNADESNTDETPTDESVTDNAATDETDGTGTDANIGTDTDGTDTGTDDPDPMSLDELASLPPRVSGALDAASPVAPTQAACPLTTSTNDICRMPVECADADACLATFDWIYAASSMAGGASKLILRSLSGDGTVVAGDEVLNADPGARNAYVWRWGSSELTTPASGSRSSATALNFDASAMVGAQSSCSSCDYEYVVWTADSVLPFPAELNSPRDISHERTVVGAIRDSDSILWGYIWDGGEPVLAQTLSFHKISGDGKFAAGVADGGGPVVRFDDNGTKSMPTVGTLVPYEVMDITTHGEVVVGYGLVGATGYSSFRWQVDVGAEAIAPPSGFSSIVPFSVDESGGVMVGVSRVEVDSNEGDQVQTFYWDETDGLRPFVDELAARGIELPSGMYLHTPRMSADATTVVGEGFMDTAPILWRARLVQP